MTFRASELLRFGGKPTQLFRFTRQSAEWCYTNADHDVVVGDRTYVAAPIKRSEIKQTSEAPQDKITINVPYVLDPNAAEKPVTQALGDNWNPFIPSDSIQVVCMAMHLNDPDRQVAVEWIGFVSQPAYSDGKLELTCLPPGSISKARYQGPKFQRGCWKTLNSTGPRGCNLPRDKFAVPAKITALDGLTATLSATHIADLPRSGTWLSWGASEQRSVTGGTGQTLAIAKDTGLAPSAEVVLLCPLAGAVTAVDGLAVTVAEFDQAVDLSAGYVTWLTAAGRRIWRVVTAHEGDTLTLAAGGEDLAPGLSITALAPLAASVDSVSGLTITSTGFGSAPFVPTGGWLQWTDAAGALHRWLVDSASSNDLALHASDAAIANGMALSWHAPIAGHADAINGVALRITALATAARTVGAGVVQ
ncbi:MAG TPA: DUF2163 domain-containing protein, partial [Burkholderiaceae bacterium]